MTISTYRDWTQFLSTQQTSDNTCADTNIICALKHLAVLHISGADSAEFLQGQLSCNINELTDSKSFFTAFSNAKGRTISTLLILKTPSAFLVILPLELLKIVQKKLQMYVLRAQVKIEDYSEQLCILGIQSEKQAVWAELLKQPFDCLTDNVGSCIKLPLDSQRYLLITPIGNAQQNWQDLITSLSLAVCDLNVWQQKDISAGIPWLNIQSTELFVAQMLNIDKLGGISFNKGCYTGQEVIARTHYLGKTNRRLFLAGCDHAVIIDNDTQIINHDDEQAIGKIISTHISPQQTRILTVIKCSDIELKNLTLNNSNQDKIQLFDFQ